MSEPDTAQAPMKSEVLRAARARRRALRRLVKRIVYAVVGVAVVGAIVLAWMPRPIPVETASVARGPLQVTVDEDGQTRVKDRYVVSAPLAGSLARIARDPGDAVREGEILGRIAPTAPALLDERSRAGAQARLSQALAAEKQAQAQAAHAQASHEYAVAEAERQRRLFAQGAAPRAAVEESELAERRATHELAANRFGVRVAAYEVEMARAALAAPGAPGDGDLAIPSPITGRVLKVLHKSEGVVAPGAPLVEVGDPAALEVAVDVLTSDAVKIRPGAPAILDGWGGPTLTGLVRTIEPAAFTRLSALGVEEQRVNLIIDLLSPRELWQGLGDGYRVEAHVVVWEGADVVKVPTSALFRHGAGWALYRVERGAARLVAVELGQRTARDAEIVSGVAAGEVVITHPSDRVADGVKVAAAPAGGPR